MSSGFGAGFLKGMVISALMVGALSLVTPLPPRDPGKSSQVDLATPAASGFNAARRDTSPVLPDTDQTVPKDAAPLPETTPQNPVAPKADTSPSRQPDAQGEVALPNVSTGDEDLALNTPSPETTPASPPAALGVPMPEIDNPVAAIPVLRGATLDRAPTTEVSAPPTLNRDGSSSAPLPPKAPGAGPDAGSGSGTETATVTAANPPSSVGAGALDAAGALKQNRVAFTNPEGKPLFSIILIDAGDEGLDTGVLRSFTFPVTFAIDPDMPGATAAAKILSGDKAEILALPPKGLSAPPEGSDAATILGKGLARLPEAVGLVDRPDAKVQNAPELADQVIARLQKTGHGFISYDIGLNGADQKARHRGVYAGTVYRVLDAGRESGTVIKRYLDRAALEAGKTGAVIVVGHTYPETVTALFSWAVSSKSATVALAPVSAVLLAR